MSTKKKKKNNKIMIKEPRKHFGPVHEAMKFLYTRICK